MRLFCVAFLVLAATAAAQEFSAEIVDLRQEGAPVLAKFYFTPKKDRFDITPDVAKGAILLNIAHGADWHDTDIWLEGSPSIMIRDGISKQATVLWPDAKKYLTYKWALLVPSQKYAHYASSHPKNVDDACPEWMDNNPAAKGETCRKVGPETLNGRDTVLYELSCYHELCRLWIDKKLHSLVKRETKWNTTELRNIKEEPQPAALFELPADYTRTKAVGVIHQRAPE